MVLDYGPKGNSSSIDFNFGKLNPLKDILFSYSIDEVNYNNETLINAQIAGVCFFSYKLNDTKNWDLKILKNCNLSFNKKSNINLFLVSGGGKGQNGYQRGSTTGTDSSTQYQNWGGGQGGFGGNILLKTNEQILKTYNIQCLIGEGATSTNSIGGITSIKIFENNNQISNDQNYSISGQLIDNNLNRDYGIGGIGGSYISFGINNGASNSNINDNEINGYLYHGNYYGAGGGGGGAAYAGHTSISSGHPGGDGGQEGGGNGGGNQNNDYDGVNGAANTGSGGGGGAASPYQGAQYTGSGGNGGSGIIIISNY